MSDGPRRKGNQKKKNTPEKSESPPPSKPRPWFDLILGRHLTPADQSAAWTARGTVVLAIIGAAGLWLSLYANRAEIVPENAYFSDGPIQPSKAIEISTEVRNPGGRVAEITDERIGIIFNNPVKDLPQNPDYSNMATLFDNMAGFVYPGQLLVGKFIPMSQGKHMAFSADQLDALNAGRASFYLYGYFTYRDDLSLVFHTTIGFCYEYSKGNLIQCGQDGRNYIYVR